MKKNVVKKIKQETFTPYYGGFGGKMSSGAGWGGEAPIVKKKKLSIKDDPKAMLLRGMQGKKK